MKFCLRTNSNCVEHRARRYERVPRRHAFTLVELLVVIAMIGILVAMLLPAVQASRESARRSLCMNQIRELILAVHDFEMANEHFPAGTVNPQGPIQNLPNGQHLSWTARLLPYLDEPALEKNLDLSLSAYDQKNDRVRQTTIGMLLCPSCGVPEWPRSDYAGCHHDVEAPINSDNNGVLFLNSQLTREDLKDGAAYTLFLGEKLPDDFDLGWLSGTPSTLRNTGISLNQRPVPPLGPPPWVTGPSTGDAANSEAPVPQADAAGRLPHARLGGNANNPLAVGGFASNHVAGANFAMGDGAVRFINDDVSISVMERLANRADGAILDAKEL